MREFNLLKIYPQPDKPRYVGPRIRTIHNKISASYRDDRYYDGDRRNGYGGFKYDGRWKAVVDASCSEYDLTENSSVLQIGCEKGFLLHDFHEKFPKMKLAGLDVSDYAIENSMKTVRPLIQKGSFSKLPYRDQEFDFIFAIGVIYTLTLRDAILCLNEIQRVGKGRSFITLGSFRNEEEEKLFRYWSVLGATLLHVNDWIEVLRHVGYTGDYAFMTAKELNLQWTDRSWEEVSGK